MNNSFETFFQSNKDSYELDRIYNYEKNNDEKILIKKFKASKINTSTSLIIEKDNGRIGVEVLNIPRFYSVYLCLDVKNNEENKFKFYIKIFDTYGKEVDNIEGNNLLNIKGLNLRVYLPSYTKEDDASIYLSKNQEISFKNKLEFNEELQCYETKYKDEIGEFEIKGYKRSQKFEKILKEEVNEITEKSEEEPTEKSEDSNKTIWIALGVFFGCVLLLIIIYFLFFSKSNKIEQFDMIPYGKSRSMKEMMNPNSYNPITAMTPRYRPTSFSNYNGF
jgi:hypothetical protein